MSKRKWTPPEPEPGMMFMSVQLPKYGSVGSSMDGNFSVSEDATLGDVRKGLVELVQTPKFLEKEYDAKLKAITVLCNRDMPMMFGDEEMPDDTKLKDLGISARTCNDVVVAGIEPPKRVSLKVFGPVLTDEGIKEAAEAENLPAEIATDDVKCIGNCGFFGRKSGYCSKCWSTAKPEHVRFYTYAFHKMQTKREEALALLGKAEEKKEEERIAKAKVEAEKSAKRAKEHEELMKKNDERKSAGKCYQLNTARLGAGWYIWSKEDFAEGDCPHHFQFWSCGVRHPEHHHADACDAAEWQRMHALMEELQGKVKHATEHTEADEPWSCFWVSKAQQVADGASDGDSVPQRLRKVLRLPDSVAFADEGKVGWGRACFWSKEQYRSNANLAKLKQATALLKKHCVKDSVVQLSFDPDHQGPCYPVIMAGLAKDGDHLICSWGNRVWT